eukprot:gene10176-2337_t
MLADTATDPAHQHLQDILKQFDLEVERRAERMKSKVRFLKASITRQFTIELMRIPKAVKSLTIQEFRAALASASQEDSQLGTDVPGTVRRGPVRRSTRQSTMRTTVKPSTKKGKSVGNRVSFRPDTSFKENSTCGRIVNNSTSAYETPANIRDGGRLQLEELGFDPRLPKTPYLRPVRHGESLISINGSPVAVDASMSRINKSCGRNTIITVPLKSGKALELNSDNTDSIKDLLSTTDKDEALSELQSLQSQLTSLIQTFQQQA